MSPQTLIIFIFQNIVMKLYLLPTKRLEIYGYKVLRELSKEYKSSMGYEVRGAICMVFGM